MQNGASVKNGYCLKADYELYAHAQCITSFVQMYKWLYMLLALYAIELKIGLLWIAV